MSDTVLADVRWGIIGAGDVCEVKSGPALQRAAGSSLVAVMRRDGAKAADFARRHGVPKWYDDADALIADPDINAIYVATPPAAHADITARAAAAGKPVYVEKPMARTHAECLAMLQACSAAGVKLFVAYYRRRLPNILKVKALLRDGVIGELLHVDVRLSKPLGPAARDPANWRVDPVLAGGGLFYDMGSHQLDVLDYLLGPIVAASGMAANRAGGYATTAEDTTVGHWRHESGVLGHGTWCFAAPEEDCITLTGTKGSIRFDCFTAQQVTRADEGGAAELFSFEIPPHIQQPLVQTVVDDLRGVGTCPSTGVSGARTSWVLDQLCQRVDSP